MAPMKIGSTDSYASSVQGLQSKKTSMGQKKVEPEEQQAVRELINTENKVIAHEQAHKSAGGEFTGPASYSYTQGPDGRRYITGGEVSIKIPHTDNKEQMIQMLERVKQAALAPADPSGQDLRVAAGAAAKQQTIRSELQKDRANAMIKQAKAANAYGQEQPSYAKAQFDQKG